MCACAYVILWLWVGGFFVVKIPIGHNKRKSIQTEPSFVIPAIHKLHCHTPIYKIHKTFYHNWRHLRQLDLHLTTYLWVWAWIKAWIEWGLPTTTTLSTRVRCQTLTYIEYILVQLRKHTSNSISNCRLSGPNICAQNALNALVRVDFYGNTRKNTRPHVGKWCEGKCVMFAVLSLSLTLTRSVSFAVSCVYRSLKCSRFIEFSIFMCLLWIGVVHLCVCLVCAAFLIFHVSCCQTTPYHKFAKAAASVVQTNSFLYSKLCDIHTIQFVDPSAVEFSRMCVGQGRGRILLE